MNYDAFLYKMFCRPALGPLEDQGLPVPDTVFIVDPNAPNPFTGIGLSRAFQFAEGYAKSSVFEKWTCAQQFVADDTYNRIRFIKINSAEVRRKQPTSLGSLIALDFWFF